MHMLELIIDDSKHLSEAFVGKGNTPAQGPQTST